MGSWVNVAGPASTSEPVLCDGSPFLGQAVPEVSPAGHTGGGPELKGTERREPSTSLFNKRFVSTDEWGQSYSVNHLRDDEWEFGGWVSGPVIGRGVGTCVSPVSPGEGCSCAVILSQDTKGRDF